MKGQKIEPEVFDEPKAISELRRRVEAVYGRHGVAIRPSSDLGRMLRQSAAIQDQAPSWNQAQWLAMGRAWRVLRAIDDCSEEPGIRDTIFRITSKELVSPQPSQGKDALFELEFLQYVRHRGLTAKLAEPDLVIQWPHGHDYFVACKTINSPNNLTKQLREGRRQLEKRGAGFVALNLEPSLAFAEPIVAETSTEVDARLDDAIQSVIKRYGSHFEEKMAKDFHFDGVAVQASCLASVATHRGAMTVMTRTGFFIRSLPGKAIAHARFSAFAKYMSNSRYRSMHNFVHTPQ